MDARYRETFRGETTFESWVPNF